MLTLESANFWLCLNCFSELQPNKGRSASFMKKSIWIFITSSKLSQNVAYIIYIGIRAKEDLTSRIKGCVELWQWAKLANEPLESKEWDNSLVQFLSHSTPVHEMPFIIIDTQLQYQPALEAVPVYLYKHTVLVNSTDDLTFKCFNVAQSIRTSVLL